MEGYEETGITIMRTDKGMDSGDIITCKSINIEDNDEYELVSDAFDEFLDNQEFDELVDESDETE